MTRSVVISLLVAVIFLAACNNTGPSLSTPTIEAVGKKISVAGGSYTDVGPSELQTMLINKDFILVDVWNRGDGYIPSTDLFIHFSVFEKNLDKFPDKNAKIVLYCLGGEKSRKVAETLVGLGYTNVYRLVGGVTNWETAGLEVIR